MKRTRHLLVTAAAVVAALLTGCQSEAQGEADGDRGGVGESLPGGPVSIGRLTAAADRIGPDGAGTCPLPFDFEKAVAVAGIKEESGPGAAVGTDEPAATAENGTKAEEGEPFALNPGGLVSCRFHIGAENAEVHVVAAQRAYAETLLMPVMVFVGGQSVDDVTAYLRETAGGKPGEPVLAPPGNFATVRVDPAGEGDAALLLTVGEAGRTQLDGQQVTALSRALHGQIT